MPLRTKIFFFLLVLALTVLGGAVEAQTSSYGKLQAAYMYNFAKYISWPDEENEFIIGIYKDADIMDDLETTLKGRKIRGMVIVLKNASTPEELLDCSIVYLSESNSRSLSTLITSLVGKSILLVTEKDLIKKGATISFVVDDNKLRFKVEKKGLDDAGLTASEGLLKLAMSF